MKPMSEADPSFWKGLSASRIDCLREDLQQELARLTQSFAALWPQEVQAENRSRISADHSDARYLASDLYDHLQERRAVIVRALERMRLGTYGRCTVCGQSIPYERLRVLPEASTCIGCCV